MFDAYGRGGGSTVSYTVSVNTSQPTAITVSVPVSAGAASYFHIYSIAYTGDIIGTVTGVSEYNTSGSVTFAGLTNGSRQVVVVIVCATDGSMTYSTQIITVGYVPTVPGVPSFAITPTIATIGGTLTPVASPVTGLPTYQSVSLYRDMGSLTFIDSRTSLLNVPWGWVFDALPNKKYWILGYVSNTAGSNTASTTVWTPSDTITTPPTAIDTISLSGTPTNRTISWTGAVGAAQTTIFIWEYVGAPTYFGTQYVYTAVEGNSLSGITNIPTGKNIYISLRAENWKNYVTKTLNTYNN
jgi:hypothetical protein